MISRCDSRCSTCTSPQSTAWKNDTSIAGHTTTADTSLTRWNHLPLDTLIDIPFWLQWLWKSVWNDHRLPSYWLYWSGTALHSTLWNMCPFIKCYATKIWPSLSFWVRNEATKMDPQSVVGQILSNAMNSALRWTHVTICTLRIRFCALMQNRLGPASRDPTP